MSIRAMTRNVCILTEDAYLDLEDKKTHDYKGVIESSRRAEEIKDFLAAKLSKKKNDELEEILQFARIANGDTGDKSIQELMQQNRITYTSSQETEKEVEAL